MIIDFNIKTATTLQKARNSIINQEKYADYLAKEFCTLVEDSSVKYYSDILGEGTVVISLSYLDAVDDDLSGHVHAKMIVNTDIDEETLYMILDDDINLHTFIKENVDKYIEYVNNNIKYVKHPYRSDLAFFDSRLYVEISHHEDNYEVEWQSFQYETDIDIDIIRDNYIIT